MMRIAFLFVALLWAAPANARCFLFFCAPPHHHIYHHHRHARIVHRTIVQHKTVVKKIIIVRERKGVPTVDRTPITPLK